MNLKESYRYSNYLENMVAAGQSYLLSNDFLVVTTQEHQRVKVNAEAKDEVIIVPKSFDVDFKPADVIKAIQAALDEREALMEAIAISKAAAPINIDSAVSMNKRRQTLISNLKRITAIKPTEKVTLGVDYKFDVNNEQKPYNYPVKTTTTLDFDKDEVKGLIKELTQKCDEISTQLDEVEVNTKVDFVPKFKIVDTFEDLVAFVGKQTSEEV